MILCVNANAAIDKTVLVSPFRLNNMHRPQQVRSLPGGKGCNVARALKQLGETPLVSGWVGGYAGQFIEAGLRSEGIEADFIHLDAESRTCLSILDPDNSTLTEIYEKGEAVPTEKIEEFKNHFQSVIGNYRAVTLSGSLPAGVQADFYAQLIEIARGASIPVLLDTSGEPLRTGIEAKPTLIKPNKKEFADLTGQEPASLTDAIDAAGKLAIQRNIQVVLSLGSDGAVCSNGKEVLHGQPPHLKVQSAVGSGDCMLAGIVYGLTHDFTFEDAIRYGIAAGTANALTIGAGVFEQNDFERLLSQVVLTRY